MAPHACLGIHIRGTKEASTRTLDDGHPHREPHQLRFVSVHTWNAIVRCNGPRSLHNRSRQRRPVESWDEDTWQLAHL